MKIIIKTSTLQEILDLASRFVSKHSTLPVLENIYIKGHIDTLIFRATDMEKYINIEIPAKIDTEWSITINAKTFTDIARTIDTEEIELFVDETKDIMTIKTSLDEFKIKWIPATEYVAVPEVSGWTSVQINASHFSKWVSKIDFAVSERGFSPILTGILLRLKKYDDGNKLVFVGTDTFRLAEYKIKYDGDAGNMDIIVPKVNVGDIKKVAEYCISKWIENMTVNFSENLVSFLFEIDWMKILTTSLLIQWNFPEYENENIIPTKHNTKFLIDKNSLDLAIRKILILTRDINNFIDMTVDTSKISVKSWETDMGEWNTAIDAVVEWEPINFGINGKFISDFIKSCEWSNLSINIVDSIKPVVFKDKDDENFVYIVRPLAKK